MSFISTARMLMTTAEELLRVLPEPTCTEKSESISQSTPSTPFVFSSLKPPVFSQQTALQDEWIYDSDIVNPVNMCEEDKEDPFQNITFESTMPDEPFTPSVEKKQKRKRNYSQKIIVIPSLLKSRLVIAPSTTFFVNKPYISLDEDIAGATFHQLMSYVFSFLHRPDGTARIISGRRKTSACIVLKTLLFLNRPLRFRTPYPNWEPIVNPIFSNTGELNLFIQRYRLFIHSFYNFSYTGRVETGVQLLERPVTIVSDDELSRPHAYRFLLKSWRECLSFEV